MFPGATAVSSGQLRATGLSPMTYVFAFFLALQSSCDARTTWSDIFALPFAPLAVKAGLQRPPLILPLFTKHVSSTSKHPVEFFAELLRTRERKIPAESNSKLKVQIRQLGSCIRWGASRSVNSYLQHFSPAWVGTNCS
eukprot:1659716-Rhodomonas_salina.2